MSEDAPKNLSNVQIVEDIQETILNGKVRYT
jgi:hypothetical protein